MKKRFICATREICDFSHRIPAPYLRRAFDLDFAPERAAVSVCGLGFYRLWVNGQEITKGYCAPYISNPDDRMYFDTYDLLPYLRHGKNAIGALLGNGFQNDFGVGLALILPLFFGLDGVLYSMPAADILTAILSALIILKTVRQLNRQIGAQI